MNRGGVPLGGEEDDVKVVMLVESPAAARETPTRSVASDEDETIGWKQMPSLRLITSVKGGNTHPVTSSAETRFPTRKERTLNEGERGYRCYEPLS